MSSTSLNMALSSEQLQILCNTAIEAAKEAGQWIEKQDSDNLQRIFKDAGNSRASQVVTEIDIRSEEIIRRHLQKISQSLNIAFVGEESTFSHLEHSNKRFEKPYFWCVDPLDGTLAYTEGRSGYAVSIALVEQSGRPLIGVAYDPVRHVVLHAIAGQGSYRNFEQLSQTDQTSKSLIVYADTSFKIHVNYNSVVKALEQCAQVLELGEVTFMYGSGAVKNAWQVIESNQACYLKLPKKEDGGGSIWDFAATACIARETGTWVSDIHGQPLALNRRDSTFMNHKGVIFASNNTIAEFLIKNL